MFSTHSIQMAEYSCNRFRMVVPKETTKDDLMNSKLYRDLVKFHKNMDKGRFSFGDILEVLAEDGSFYAELLILGSTMEELFSKINYFVFHLETKELLEVPAYKIEWKGPKNKFAILRKADDSIFRQHFSSKEEALSFLQNIPA